MEAIEELVQLSESMRQASAVLADEDVDESAPAASSSGKRGSTFLYVVALGNVVSCLFLWLGSGGSEWLDLFFVDDVTGLESVRDDASPAGSNRCLILVQEPPPSVDRPSDHILCTYHCRQMVKSDFLEALSSAEKEAKEYCFKFKDLSERLDKTS